MNVRGSRKDNSSELQYNKINSYFGVEIFNLEDITSISDVQIIELKKLIYEYYFVVIKGSRVWTEKEQVDLTGKLGRIELPPIYSIPLTRINQERKKKRLIKETGIQWHSDNSDKERPSFLSLFQMQKIPFNGTETFFVSLIDSYSELTNDIVDRWSNYNVRYSSNAQHPMLWKHPYNGKSTIYFDFAFVSCIHDTSNENKEITVKLYNQELDHLNNLLTHHPSHYTHKWEIGDMLIIDNYAISHRANFVLVDGDSRILLRTTTEGVYF